MKPTVEYIELSLPREDMTLAEYRRTRTGRRPRRLLR
jgi:hypothetical protein